MFTTRRIPRTTLLLQPILHKPIRTFHQTAVNMVKVGDSLPNVDLVEGSPSDKVNLSKELASGKGLIIGVPAAFSEYIYFPPNTDRRVPQLGKRSDGGSLLTTTRSFLLGHPYPRLCQQ